MAVSMSSRPSGSLEAAPPSVTLRRSPRFDPYKASSAQRAQQRATPRSLKGTVDPSAFAVVPPVLVPKRKRKTSTTATTSADRARATSKATRRASSSLKENEAKEFRQASAFTGKAIHLGSAKRRLEETGPAGISPIKTRSTRRSAAVVSEEQTEFAPAPRRLLKKKGQPATTEDEVLPRVIIKSVKAQKQPCTSNSKDKATAGALESTTVSGRFLRPRHRVAGSVIAQTCKSTAASLYKSIVTTILPSSTSKGRKCRKTGVAVAVSTSQLTTAEVQELVAPSSSSAPIATLNNSSASSATESLFIGDSSLASSSYPSSTVNPATHTSTISTSSAPSSSTPDAPLATKPSHNPATPYSELLESPRAAPYYDGPAIGHPEGPEHVSPYLNVVAVPTSPLPSYPAPSTYDTVDMGSMPHSDIQAPISSGNSDSRLTTSSSFIESTYSTLTYALTPVPHLTSASVLPPSTLNGDAVSLDVNAAPAGTPFASCIPASPHFPQAPVDPYVPFPSPCNPVSLFSPSFPSSSPSSFSDIVAAPEHVGCHQPDVAVIVPDGTLLPSMQVPYLQVQQPEAICPSPKVDNMAKDMDVSMEPVDEVPASESDLGFGFVPQEQVQTIQLPEVSFVVPAPVAEEYSAPTFWPRHAKLTVEWNMFSKSQRWHEYLAQIHAQLLVVPNPGLRKEGNLKRVYVAPDLKPMHEVGYQLNDRSLFVTMSRGRVFEICRRMGAETIRDIVADEAWRFFKKTGVFPTNFARTWVRNPPPPQSRPRQQSSQPDSAPVQGGPVSKDDPKGEEDVEDAIVDFMSEEIYDFELEDEDAMEEDEDALEDARLDPRLPARFCIYFPEEDDDDDEFMEVVDIAVESNDVQDDDETEDDSSYSDDSDDSDDPDDMELIASTDMDESVPDDGTSGCSFIELDLQLSAQEPTSPTSLAHQENLFHVPIAHLVNFDQSAWEDARQLHGMLQTAQDAQRQGLADPRPSLPINVGMLKIPLNIPSFASIRLRFLSGSDSFSCGQLPLRGTKADKVINFAWHLSPTVVATTDFTEHHAHTGSVAVRPPRVYRHAIIKPPEVIKSLLRVAFVEVAQLSQNRKRVREQQDQHADDLERSRPRLRLDSGIADQQASSPSMSTCVSPGQGSAMAWMSMVEAQPQQGMNAPFQTGLQFQSVVLETAYTQVTDMFQQGGAWYYGMPPATSNDFPPVHHAPPQVYAQSTSSSLSNALG